jgi:hypothetical protein
VFRLVIAVILIVAGVTFSQQAQSSGLPINPSLTIPVWTGIVVLGWLVFQYGVWSGSWRAFTSPQTIVLKTEKTPFQVLMGSVNSCAMTLIGGGVLILIALSVTGHGDLAMKILDIFFTKIIKIVQALFT